MIDLKDLAQNTEIYTRELEIRSMDVSLAGKTKVVYEKWKERKNKLDGLRSEKNDFNRKVVKLEGEEKQQAIEDMKLLSQEIKSLEEEVRSLKSELDELAYQIPNLTWKDIPLGADESGNVITNTFGQKPNYDFEPKNYYELPIFQRDYLSEKGVEAFGTRGYYIKGELAKFQRILFDYILDILIGKGFEYIIPPIMVNEKSLYGTGFFPDGRENMYEVLAGDRNFYLVGTSEAPLMFMHSQEVLNLDKPRLLTAWTTCFRKESGSYGKDTQGGIRVHQFEKIETVAICKPEDSDKVFDFITDNFTQNMLSLGLHLQHLEICSGDIGVKNYRQIDVEAWFPAQKKFRELSSSSNCTDYQTRNLNIRYLDQNGEQKLAHSLNCTGVVNRTMFAIMEQYQQADGSVVVPEVLRRRYGKSVLK
jgi:seryl-tRNA synthetase